MVVATAVVFLVSLVLGVVGIYVGARIIVGVNDFDHAYVFTPKSRRPAQREPVRSSHCC